MRLDVTLDSNDVDGVAAFWAGALGDVDDEHRWMVMADPEGNELCVVGPRADRDR
jgi:hypothetical protein